MKKFVALLLGAALLGGVVSAAGCSKEDTPSERALLQYTQYKSQGADDAVYDEEIIYRNDLKTHGADPSVIYIEEGDQAGYFYMYVTGIGRGYECFRSKDLNTWEKVGVAYEYTNIEKDGNTYVSFAKSSHWAPEVVYDEELGLYMLFYSAGDNMSFYLDCAVSDKPQGPFVQYAVYIQDLAAPENATQEEKDALAYWKKQLAPRQKEGSVYVYPALVDFRNLRAQKEGETDADYISAGSEDGYMKVIDACPYIDPVTGNKYLYFVRDLGESGETSHRYATSSIGALAMDKNWRPLLEEDGTVDKDGEIRYNYADARLLTEVNRYNVGDVLEDSKMNEGNVNEGPYMLYNETSKKYYLLYSCNSYWEKMYSVRVAVGDSPMGPFTKLSREQGGWLLYAEPTCSWISGTGHNSVAEKNGKQYIVYHQHVNRASGNGTRAVGFDELVWVTNKDGLLIPHANGGSYSYMPQTTGEWSNIATEAEIAATGVKEGSDAKFANDGAVKFHDDGVISELQLSGGSAEITLSFKDYRQVRALFVFNSYYYEQAFSTVESVEFYCKDGEGKEYIAYTEKLEFDWEQYFADDEYIPGGSFAIGFTPISVKKIVVRLPASQAERAVSEIMVLGK